MMHDLDSRSDRELLVSVAQTTAATSATLLEIKERMDRNEGMLKDHEDRMRVLENLRWWIYGALVTAGGAAADVIHRMFS